MGNIFGVIFVRPLGLILEWIMSFANNYGIALVIFTIIIKLILLPFMYKQKKSMKKMNLVTAESQAIQKRYAKNKEKANEEISKLYEREGVNPMTSCLLSFITLPVMMGLYYAVRQPMTYMMGLSSETINKIAEALGTTYDAKSVSGQIELAKMVNDNWDAVSRYAADGLTRIDFNFFGIDLSGTPSFTSFNALWLIPIVSGGTALLSSLVMRKMQNKQNPNAQKNNSAQMNSTMNSMLILMPLMQVWIAFSLPASMGVYWTVNNLFTMAQEVVLTWYITTFDKAEDDEETKARKRREAAHQMRLQEQEEEEGTSEEYLGAKSENVSKKKLKAREAEEKKLKEKETAARAAEIKAKKEQAHREGRSLDEEE